MTKYTIITTHHEYARFRYKGVAEDDLHAMLASLMSLGHRIEKVVMKKRSK